MVRLSDEKKNLDIIVEIQRVIEWNREGRVTLICNLHTDLNGRYKRLHREKGTLDWLQGMTIRIHKVNSEEEYFEFDEGRFKITIDRKWKDLRKTIDEKKIQCNE